MVKLLHIGLVWFCIFSNEIFPKIAKINSNYINIYKNDFFNIDNTKINYSF